MPTKTGSVKSKLPGHLRLCDKNILILNIFFFIKKKKNQIKSIINKSINTKNAFHLVTFIKHRNNNRAVVGVRNRQYLRQRSMYIRQGLYI